MDLPQLKGLTLKKLLSDKLLRKGLSMVMWRLTSLVLTFSSSVWIARCLGPEEMGRSGFILATGSQVLLLMVVCPNTFAIRLVKGQDGSADAIASIVTARAYMAILYIMAMGIAFAVGAIPSAWTLLVLIGFMYPVLVALDPGWLLQAQENQPAQYKSGAFTALVGFIFAATVIRPGGVASEDLTARILSTATGLIVAWLFVKRGNPMKFITLKQWKRSWKAFCDGRVLMLTDLVVYLYIGLELPLLAYLATVEELGMYRTATQLVAAANSFLIMLPMLYYPRFIEWQKISSAYLWQMQKRFFSYAVLIVVPVVGMTVLVGPWAYRLVFGAEYSMAGVPFAMLLCSKLIVILNGIFAWGQWARSKDGSMLGIIVTAAVFSITSNLIFIPLYGMMAAATVNVSSQLIVLCLTFVMANRQAKHEFAQE